MTEAQRTAAQGASQNAMHLEILSGVFKDPRPRRQRRTRGPPPNGRFAPEGPSHFAMDLQPLDLTRALVAARKEGRVTMRLDLNEGRQRAVIRVKDGAPGVLLEDTGATFAVDLPLLKRG